MAASLPPVEAAQRALRAFAAYEQQFGSSSLPGATKQQSVAWRVPDDFISAESGQGGPALHALGTVAQKIVDPEGRVYYDPAADAAARTAYYANIDPTENPQALFAALSGKQKATHTRELTYREARHEHLYPWVDLHPQDLKLHGVYSGEAFDPAKLIRQELEAERRLRLFQKLSSQLGGFFGKLLNAVSFNTEHSVPQSWFDKRDPMRGDLHALFTASPHCNSMRSNAYYADIQGKADETSHCGKRKGKQFEPARNKGAVARATLYFLLRYPGEINPNEMPKGTIETLLAWHAAEPPSLWEKHRNAEIAKVQGNRNPLIDHPEWATKIDFSLGFGS